MIIITTLTIVITGCGKKEKITIPMTVRSFIGDVKIKSLKGETTVQAGMIIELGDTIITGKNSRTDITYGNKGIFVIGEESKIDLTALSDGESGDTDIKIDQGSITGVLSKLGNSSFNLKTPTIVASVRGTTFKIVVGWKSSKLFVLKGKVQVKPVNKGKILHEKSVSVTEKQRIEVDTALSEKLATNADMILKPEPIKSEETEEIKKLTTELKNDILNSINNDSRNEIMNCRELNTNDEKSVKPVKATKKVIKTETAAKIKDEVEKKVKVKDEAVSVPNF